MVLEMGRGESMRSLRVKETVLQYTQLIVKSNHCSGFNVKKSMLQFYMFTNRLRMSAAVFICITIFEIVC